MPTSVNGDVNFTYDGNRQRVKKSSPVGTRVYVDKLYECSDGSCGKYIFAGDTRIALKRGAELFYYHQDHLGSTVVVTDGNGAVAGAPGNTAENIAYYPFGETRSDAGVENLNHKYTSQEFDYESGLYNYNARLYDPELGRFISADSIVPDPANPQSLNRYSYVENNPINFTDPTGHCKFWKCIEGAAEVIVGAALIYYGDPIVKVGGGVLMGYGVTQLGGESEGTASATVATYGGNSSTSGSGSSGTGSGGGSGSGNGVPIGNTGATYVGPGASAINTAVNGGTWSEVVNSMTSINNTSAGNTSLYLESGVATGGSASANSSLGMIDGVKMGLSGGFNAVRVAGPRAFEAVQIAGQKTGGALVGMAENGPPVAQATLALATYTLIGPVAGPVATTYALTNPQGALEFITTQFPGPATPLTTKSGLWGVVNNIFFPVIK